MKNTVQFYRFFKVLCPCFFQDVVIRFLSIEYYASFPSILSKLQTVKSPVKKNQSINQIFNATRQLNHIEAAPPCLKCFKCLHFYFSQFKVYVLPSHFHNINYFCPTENNICHTFHERLLTFHLLMCCVDFWTYNLYSKYSGRQALVYSVDPDLMPQNVDSDPVYTVKYPFSSFRLTSM